MNRASAEMPPNAFSRALAQVLIWLVRAWQVGLSPFLGSSCRFHPSCSAYAAEARKDIGDWQVPGTGQRKAGRVDNPVHPATTTDIKSTDWIGNPDSPQYDPGKKTRPKK